MGSNKGPVWPQSLPYLLELQRGAAKDAGVEWKHTALRHSFISYRVADVKNVAEVALEAGNSPDVIFQHYRELVTGEKAKEWFGITPAVIAAESTQLKAEGARLRAAKVLAHGHQAGTSRRRRGRRPRAERSWRVRGLLLKWRRRSRFRWSRAPLRSFAPFV